jgi:fumarylacetoacetase
MRSTRPPELLPIADITMVTIDHTHDATRTSWVASANGHAEFPIQNLPIGIFRTKSGAPRAGVPIGDSIFDVEAALDAGLFSGEAEQAAVSASDGRLNAFLALGAHLRRSFRLRLFDLLAADTDDGRKARGIKTRLLHASAACVPTLPAEIGAYTDFYCGIHHATKAGSIFRPGGEPLPRNYKYVPIGYNGRASSIVASGTAIRRPLGQRLNPNATVPEFGACVRLDYELELGVWIGAGNELGTPIPISEAGEHIAGFCLLNDWSARDLQAWEGQPLGPFLSKSFATSISPWIVTPEALAPFRCAMPERPAGDPQPLPYLWNPDDQREGALNIELEICLRSAGMKRAGLPPLRVSHTNASELYWTTAQMVAHHTSNGCNLRAGDILASGTISSAGEDGRGCLLERTEGGRVPFQLSPGESRTYLEDGDEVIFAGHASRAGFASIGFGECCGVVLPALAIDA